MKKFWTSEKILSISAILISLGMFISIVYQNRLIQKHQSASVLPYLEIWNSQNIGRFQLVVLNNGLGPAFIKDIRIIHKGEVYEGDPYRFFVEEIIKKDTIKNVQYSNVLPGRLIPAGERIEMIAALQSEESAKSLASWFADDSVVLVEIEYESVYGDRWITSGHANIPKRIN